MLERLSSSSSSSRSNRSGTGNGSGIGSGNDKSEAGKDVFCNQYITPTEDGGNIAPILTHMLTDKPRLATRGSSRPPPRTPNCNDDLRRAAADNRVMGADLFPFRRGITFSRFTKRTRHFRHHHCNWEEGEANQDIAMNIAKCETILHAWVQYFIHPRYLGTQTSPNNT